MLMATIVYMDENKTRRQTLILKENIADLYEAIEKTKIYVKSKNGAFFSYRIEDINDIEDVEALNNET